MLHQRGQHMASSFPDFHFTSWKPNAGYQCPLCNWSFQNKKQELCSSSPVVSRSWPILGSKSLFNRSSVGLKFLNCCLHCCALSPPTTDSKKKKFFGVPLLPKARSSDRVLSCRVFLWKIQSVLNLSHGDTMTWLTQSQCWQSGGPTNWSYDTAH